MALRPTIREVVAQLTAAGDLGTAPEEAIRAALASSGGESEATPWFVRVLLGMGAWTAALLFVGFLWAAKIVDSGGSGVAVGLILAAIAVGVRRVTTSGFLRHLALAVALCGEITLVAGVGHHHSASVTAAAALALELAMLELYPDTVHRFLSTLACGLAAAVLLEPLKSPLAADAYVVTVGLLLGLTWTLRPSRGAKGWSVRQAALGYGLAVVLFAALAVRLLVGASGPGGPLELVVWLARDPSLRWLAGGRFAAIGLSVALLALEASIFHELSFRPAHPAAVAVCLGTLALCAVTASTPGIAAAVGVLALGFHRRRGPLIGLAVASLVAFGGFYYYSLSMSLLAKSGVLVASGLVLLALRFALTGRRAAEGAA